MKSETILRALSAAKSEYLEQAAEPQKVRKRSMRRFSNIGLIAAALAGILLITGAAAAVMIYAPRIILTKQSEESFDLTIKNTARAEDTPGYLAQYYLPTALPEGSVLANGNASWGLYLDWDIPTTGGNGQIAFSQFPLRKDMPEETFRSWSGIDSDALTQGTCEIGGTQYWTLTHASVYGSATTYFWTDPANHYLLDASFSEVIPQSAREAFLRSVAPASQLDVFAMMGIEHQTAWCLGNLPEGWQVNSYELNTNDASLCASTSASDGIAHDIFLKQGAILSKEDTISYEQTKLVVDSIPIDCYIALTAVEGNSRREEIWCFSAPGGNTPLQLTFFSDDGSEFTESEKLQIFRGLQETAMQDLDLSELNRQK